MTARHPASDVRVRAEYRFSLVLEGSDCTLSLDVPRIILWTTKQREGDGDKRSSHPPRPCTRCASKWTGSKLGSHSLQSLQPFGRALPLLARGRSAGAKQVFIGQKGRDATSISRQCNHISRHSTKLCLEPATNSTPVTIIPWLIASLSSSEIQCFTYHLPLSLYIGKSGDNSTVSQQDEFHFMLSLWFHLLCCNSLEIQRRKEINFLMKETIKLRANFF